MFGENQLLNTPIDTGTYIYLFFIILLLLLLLLLLLFC